jgi:hypothetical protein
MCLKLHSPTARKIWSHPENLFTGNKPSHAVHLECKLHNLVQGDMSAHDYCLCLQHLANSLADCDAPVSDRALVHQLIWGLNPKFVVLRTLLLLLPRFPTFIEARNLILSDELAHEADLKRSAETALLATDAASPKPDVPPPALTHPDRPTTNNSYGGRGHGRGCGGARGRGGRNDGRDDGRNTNTNNALQWSTSPPWGSSWGQAWRAPWTGATDPGVLRPRLPAMLA